MSSRYIGYTKSNTPNNTESKKTVPAVFLRMVFFRKVYSGRCSSFPAIAGRKNMSRIANDIFVWPAGITILLPISLSNTELKWLMFFASSSKGKTFFTLCGSPISIFTYLPNLSKELYAMPRGITLKFKRFLLSSAIRAAPFLNGCNSCVCLQIPSIKMSTMPPADKTSLLRRNASSFLARFSFPSESR